MADDDPPRLFTRAIHFDRRVIRRPLYFYVGLNKLGRIPVERLIKQHGGQTVSHPKAADNQIIYLIDPLSKPQADGPLVYSVHFVHECVRAGQLLDLQRFRIPHRYERASNGAPSQPVSSQRPNRLKGTAPPATPETKPKQLPEEEQQQESPQKLHSRRLRKPTTPRRTSTPVANPQEECEIPPRVKQEEGTSKRTPLPRRAKETDSPVATPQHKRRTTQIEQEAEERYHRASFPGRKRKATTPVAALQDKHRASKVEREDEDEPLRTSSARRAAMQRAINATDKREQESEILVEETSPPSRLERWTTDEDNQLVAVCDIVLRALRDERLPPTRLFHTNTWKALKNKKRLPPHRSAAQCRQRAMHLRLAKESPLETDHRVSEQVKEKSARKRPQMLDDEYEDEIQPVNNERRPSKAQRVSPPEQPRQNSQKRLSRTKQFIRSMVRSLSYETQMTQRRVFQVLRANAGDRAKTKSVLLKERRDSETQKRNRR